MCSGGSFPPLLDTDGPQSRAPGPGPRCTSRCHCIRTALPGTIASPSQKGGQGHQEVTQDTGSQLWTAGRFRAARSGSPSLSPGLAVTNDNKSHRPGAQTTRIPFAPSGGREPEIQALTDSGPIEAPFSLSSRGREPALVSSPSIRALRLSWGPTSKHHPTGGQGLDVWREIQAFSP